MSMASSSEASSEPSDDNSSSLESSDSEDLENSQAPAPSALLFESPTKVHNPDADSTSSSDTENSDDDQVKHGRKKKKTSFSRSTSQSQSRSVSSRSRSRSPIPIDNISNPVEEKDEAAPNDELVSDEDGQKQRDHDKRTERGINNNLTGKSDSFIWVGPRKSSKSEAWKFWGFKKYPKQLVNYEKVYCKLCNHCINYKGSNTNMNNHLKSKHQNVTAENSVTQPTAAQFFSSVPQARKVKYPKNHPINKRARASLVKWFCKRDRPFLMAEDPEFAEFCDILNPQFELPSRMTVTRDMEHTYANEKEKLIRKLDKVDFLFGTNDGGSAINGESFVSNTVHYIDPETWELKHSVLGCQVMTESHTAKNYREHIDATEKNFNIKDKVFGYTTDNENKMHCAFRNDERNGCIAHIQSKVMEKAVNSVKSVVLVRKKLRKLAKLNKFPKFKYALENAQKSRKLPKRKFLQEVKTRFTSTLTMFHSMMSYEPEKPKEKIRERAKANMEAINDALDKVGSKKAKKLKLKNKDLDIIINTSEVLEPICEMLTTLGGEKYVSGSIVLPYLKRVVILLKIEDTDPKYIIDMKSFIIKDWFERCRANLNFGLLKKATFLDPRFKSMKSIDPTQFEQLKREIACELEALEICDSDRAKSDNSREAPKKKKKKKKIVLESDDESGDVTVTKELENYLQESKLGEDSDPLKDFWKLKEALYPRLSILAKKYLCIQATSTPSERVFSKMGSKVSKKTNRITPTHTNESIFLSCAL